jgi:hypothetical protein
LTADEKLKRFQNMAKPPVVRRWDKESNYLS